QVTAFDFKDRGYEDLYRHLTGQIKNPKPKLGDIYRFGGETTTVDSSIDHPVVAQSPAESSGAEAVKPQRGPLVEFPHDTRVVLPATRINPADGAEMILIPAGEFIMGSNDPETWMQDSHPAHKVTLDDYYIYKNPVTVAMFVKFCDATGRKMPTKPPWGWDKADYPMVNVSWDDAVAYAKWVGAALPTEAQWEKAARGTDGRKYPWGNDWDPAKCRCSSKALGDAGSPIAVGSYPAGASPYGVLDMAGNVWEWCADWYADDTYRIFREREPLGPEKGAKRVVRGGSWNNYDEGNFRCACRTDYLPENRYDRIGFRCALRPGSS
ncbi:MAG: formylglycine-generating enzyme family protein, partial [Capsulimonadaceae bacterium]